MPYPLLFLMYQIRIHLLYPSVLESILCLKVAHYFEVPWRPFPSSDQRSFTYRTSSLCYR